jgi:glycerol-3-phosphate dehydrogenase (NAD(P)+)
MEKMSTKVERENRISSSILVHGAGSWGTALAMHLARVGHRVFLHSWEQPHNVKMVNSDRNYDYFPDIPFPSSLKAVLDWRTIINCCSNVLIAAPSMGFTGTLSQLKPHLKNQGIIVATKGFCNKDNELVHQVIEKISPRSNFGVIIGPSFAKEVATGMPTSVLAASTSIEYAKNIQQIFNSKFFRCYTSTDVIGAEVGGAIKNVLAVACGISEGLGFGTNTQSFLITRGLAELQRLGVRLGGNPETFYGLSGLGDVVLTCSDNQSRNRQFGFLLGQGKTESEATNTVKQVVEGISAAKSVVETSRKGKVSMPIAEMVYKIIYENSPVRSTFEQLLTRNVTSEDQF